MMFPEILRSVPLFAGIEDRELAVTLDCIGAELRKLRKDEILLMAGDKPVHVGIALEGRLRILRGDAEGNDTLVALITPGEMFAEALCCAGVEESPVSVAADTETVVLLLGFPRILATCHHACPRHTRLIENMLRVVAHKNLYLQSRMEIVSIRSVRAKVLRYLESFGVSRGRSIVIPLDREAMAAYLCVERSALSHELARMKQDGLIDYRKNRFVLKP